MGQPLEFLNNQLSLAHSCVLLTRASSELSGRMTKYKANKLFKMKIDIFFSLFTTVSFLLETLKMNDIQPNGRDKISMHEKKTSKRQQNQFKFAFNFLFLPLFVKLC